jgi:hypothetical protein
MSVSTCPCRMLAGMGFRHWLCGSGNGMSDRHVLCRPASHESCSVLREAYYPFPLLASRNTWTARGIVADRREQTDDSYSGVVLINNGRDEANRLQSCAEVLGTLEDLQRFYCVHTWLLCTDPTYATALGTWNAKAPGACQCPLSNSTKLLRWRATVTACGRREAADLMHAIRVQSCFPRDPVAQTAGGSHFILHFSQHALLDVLLRLQRPKPQPTLPDNQVRGRPVII